MAEMERSWKRLKGDLTMEMAEYIIFGFCIWSWLYPYNIDPQRRNDKGVRMGAGLMWKIGVWVNPKEIPTRAVELERDEHGVYDMHTILVITNANPTTTQSNTEKEW